MEATPDDSTAPMKESYRKRLYALRPKLVREVLSVDRFLVELHTDAGGFLNDEEEEEIRTQANKPEKMLTLLKILRNKDNAAYFSFCKILGKSTYGHLARELVRQNCRICEPLYFDV